MMNFIKLFPFGPYTTPYEDIMRHCRQPYISGDRMTQAHESTHQIHSELRNKAAGSRVNAFYVLEDRAAYFPEPNVTIADAVEKMPRKWRGPVYDLYVVKSRRDWNFQPLYLVDEAVAYTNGAIVGKSEGCDGWKYEAERGKELTQYAWAVILAIEAKDPGYSELDRLVRFVNWNATRNPLFGVKLR